LRFIAITLQAQEKIFQAFHSKIFCYLINAMNKW
jgi:hypothetical protein